MSRIGDEGNGYRSPVPDGTRPDPRETWPGQPFPLGASYDGLGTHFSVFSQVAEAVTLCLITEASTQEYGPLTEFDSHCAPEQQPSAAPAQPPRPPASEPRNP